FRRLGEGGRYCVEIGAAGGEENNSARLIAACGWGGLLVEAHPHSFARLSERYRGHAAARTVHVHVTSTNVEAILEAHGVPADFDLLSIDIDGNDYWVWDAVRRWRPR